MAGPATTLDEAGTALFLFPTRETRFRAIFKTQNALQEKKLLVILAKDDQHAFRVARARDPDLFSYEAMKARRCKKTQ